MLEPAALEGDVRSGQSFGGGLDVAHLIPGGISGGGGGVSRPGPSLSPGSGPAEFADLHGLILDTERHRILVADRGNSRIQVFDDEWHFIEEWPNIYAPYAMRMQTADGHV